MTAEHKFLSVNTNKIHGKNCVVTGATSGIGRSTALALGEMGANVVLIGRNTSRGKEVANRINSKFGQEKAIFLKCDLSNQTELHSQIKTIIKFMPTIDVLINNAGARFDSFQLSVDGIEMTFATNHMNYFLVTALLLPCIINSPSGRIINVAGEGHRHIHDDFQKCFNAAQFDRKVAYQQAKLANMLFTYALSERLNGTSVSVNAMHPGGVATRISMNNGILSWLRHIVAHLLNRNLISPAKGADTVVWLATSDDIKGISGKYFYQRKQLNSSPLSTNKDAMQKLWALSLHLIKPEIRKELSPLLC